MASSGRAGKVERSPADSLALRTHEIDCAAAWTWTPLAFFHQRVFTLVALEGVPPNVVVRGPGHGQPVPLGKRFTPGVPLIVEFMADKPTKFRVVVETDEML